MARSQSANLDRKKFFGDPVLVITIIALTVFLALQRYFVSGILSGSVKE